MVQGSPGWFAATSLCRAPIAAVTGAGATVAVVADSIIAKTQSAEAMPATGAYVAGYFVRRGTPAGRALVRGAGIRGSVRLRMGFSIVGACRR